MVHKSNAQPEELKFRYFNQKQGLSNTFITSITKDSTGYIWVGTINGLNRFDGRVFTPYYDNSKDTTQLQHYYITTLFIDSKSTLWVGTQNGLHSYNNFKDNFRRYHIDGANRKGEAINIGCIAENSEGDIFVSVDASLYKYHRKENVFRHFIDAPKGMISKFIFDSHDNIWIGSMANGGLSYYKNNTGKLLNFSSYELPSRVPTENIQDLELNNDTLWIGSRGQGLISYDINKKVFTKHPVGLPDTDHIVDIMISTEGKIWSIDYTGLKFYNKESKSFYGYYFYSEDPQSIRTSPAIIYQDNQNNIWVGHNGEGLGLRVPPSGFQSIFNNKAHKWYLNNVGVNAITKDVNGSLWIANSGPGITIFDYGHWKKEEKWHDQNKPHGLGAGTVFSLYTDTEGVTWVGTYEGGLQKYDSEKNRFVNYRYNPADSSSISSNDIRLITEDVNNDLWLITYGKGIDRFDKDNKRFIHFNTENSGLANPYVNDILCASSGDLWVATVWGLSMMPKNTDQFKNFYFNSDDSTSISSNNVFVLFEDSKGRIWVGTDNGLNLYSADGTFQRFDRTKLKTTICGIQEDGHNAVWLSTYNGIIRLDPELGDIQLYEGMEAVNNNSFVPRSQYKDWEGRIYFGGTKGITHFMPDEVTTNIYPPDVVFTNLHVLNQNTQPNDSSSILDKHINYANYFEIEYDDKIITFEYLGLSYNNPEDNMYMYKLDGLHDGWQSPTKQTTASFTNLQPGKYAFQVKAANNDGVWSANVAKVSFKVKPPWYRTSIFIVLVMILFVIIGWITLNIHSLRIRRQRKLLAIQVHKKTRELRQTNEELLTQAEYLDNLNKLLEERQAQLEQQSRILSEKSDELVSSNKRLKELNTTKDRLFSIIAHDLISPFNTILGMSELLMGAEEEGEAHERKKLARNVNISASHIFDLLQNLLMWAKGQTKEVKVSRHKFTVRNAIHTSITHLNEAFQQKDIQFRIECEESMEAFGDIDMFKTVVRNLVSNAIKFTKTNGIIKVIARGQGKMVEVTVEDNGIGIAPEKIPFVFEQEGLRSTYGTSGETGTGIGLFLCKDLVEKNNGSINVHSEQDKGTRFVFTIPRAVE
ncbi:sensor histidine kinase [Carboxylicivirga linearis]|uniref:histidine kinase n=1 Tax=Carboxylicivirga linearis TaxID=1628157 RepID=A0ABS5JTV7_9BACT|nr:sensor histidine kinase [Carboxylicivirga linearis]MBS2098278.1 hypothetical protein [Carboxylicivirga linearis]